MVEALWVLSVESILGIVNQVLRVVVLCVFVLRVDGRVLVRPCSPKAHRVPGKKRLKLFSLQWILWMSTGTQYCNTILILQYIKFNDSIISRKYLLSYIRWRSNYYKISNWKYTRRSSTNRHVHLCSESTELQTHAGLIRGLVAGGAA